MVESGMNILSDPHLILAITLTQSTLLTATITIIIIFVSRVK